jgi:GNAT superfamily N-acetyltransferase
VVTSAKPDLDSGIFIYLLYYMLLHENALTFRKCNLQDAGMLHDLYLQSYNEHYTYIWDDQGKAYLEKLYPLSTFQRGLLNPTNHYYIICSDIEPMGFFKLIEKEPEGFDPEACLEINKFYMLNAATGKGMGSKALAYISNLATSINRHLLWVNVMQEAKARTFYERNGFTLLSQVELDYPHMRAGLNVLSTYKKDLT